MGIKERVAGRGDCGVAEGAAEQKNDRLQDAAAARSGTGSGVMLKAVYAVLIAAVIGSGVVAIATLTDRVEARGTTVGAKSDRADARPLGGDCSKRGWPFYEASCLRDTRNAYGEARQVRLVAMQGPTPGTARNGR